MIDELSVNDGQKAAKSPYMNKTLSVSSVKSMNVSRTEINVKGKASTVPSAVIGDRTVIRRGRWLKIAAIRDEELVEGDTVRDPNSFVGQLKQSGLDADIFTFAQKLPDTAPKYKYHFEYDNFAVIPITNFSHWWEKRVEASVRRAVRKATKSGIVVREVEFDDAFVSGIVKINDETPIRQGRPFWHFQKGFDHVKRENSTYAERNIFLGAYHDGQLIGFVRMTYADSVANIVQLLSMIKHYDKRPANALIAKAVEVCEQKGFSFLAYCNYVYNDPNSSLTEFKRRNGFEQILAPRYYIPLTPKGQLALKFGFHRRLVERLPKSFVTRLLKIRNRWYERKLPALEGSL
jgi:hypothetical protein